MDSNFDREYNSWMIKKLNQEVNYLHGILNSKKIPYEKYEYSVTAFNSKKIKKKNANLTSSHIKSVDINIEYAKLFYSYFKGRPEVFAKRSAKVNVKTGTTAYYPQCENFWKDGICPRRLREKTPCKDCTNQKYSKLHYHHIIDHLKGEKANCSDVIGLYPIHKDNTCNFLVFDFDNHDSKTPTEDFANIDDKWLDEVNCIRQICKKLDIDILVERSRSGKGAHIWIFFESPVKASIARNFGSAIITKGLEFANIKSLDYYDRMLPNQDELPKDKKTGKPGLGNLIALPLQGRALKEGNSAFVDENWNVYVDQWAKLGSVKKIQASWVEEKIAEWSVNGLYGQLCENSVFENNNSTKNLPINKITYKNKFKFKKKDIDGFISINHSNDSLNLFHFFNNCIRNIFFFTRKWDSY